MPACSSSTGPPSIFVSSGGTVGESRVVGPGSSPALMAEPLPWGHPSPGMSTLGEAVPPAPPKWKSPHPRPSAHSFLPSFSHSFTA